MKRLETIDWLTKQNFQQELDLSDSIDILFCDDDYVSNNFRKKLYPEYKAQRKLGKKQYDIFKIRNYVTNVIFKDLQVEEKYGYKFLRVDGAEGDDVIACILKNFKDEYSTIVLYASDHDFLQIDGIHQFDLFGKEAKRIVGGIEVTADEYLLAKILLGDGADNIAQVFAKVGPKKAMKLVRDKDALKQKLKESQDSAKQYKLNKKLISFSEIPKTLEEKIVKEAHEKLFKNEVLNDPACDLSQFMTL
jgi:DNA polymerase-1